MRVNILSALMVIVSASAVLQAQQMRPAQPPPVLRTERVGPLLRGTDFQGLPVSTDKIPRIDGDDSDWAMVPESYRLALTRCTTMSISMTSRTQRIGRACKSWLGEGFERLYFLYEPLKTSGTCRSGLHNDTFEIVVDGDRSGGPLIPQFRNNADQDEWDAHFSMHVCRRRTTTS